MIEQPISRAGGQWPTAMLFALVVGGCATFETQTPDLIRAREEILFEGKACAGRLLRDTDTLTWDGCGPLLITPTTIYHSTTTISYSTLTSAAVEPVKLWAMYPFGSPSWKDDWLLVRETRGVCWNGCVIRILANDKNVVQDGGALTERGQAEKAARLINAHYRDVDPYGRRNGPRQVWLAAGLARAPASWAHEPTALRKDYPDEIEALQAIFTRASDGILQQYPDLLSAAVTAAEEVKPVPERYRYTNLPELKLNYRYHLDLGSLKKALADRSPALDSMLVSDISRIELAELGGAGLDASIEATFTFYLDFYDLDPPKNGAAHWHEYRASHKLSDWIALDGALLQAEINAAAIEAARQLGIHMTAATSYAVAAGSSK